MGFKRLLRLVVKYVRKDPLVIVVAPYAIFLFLGVLAFLIFLETVF